MFVVVAQFHAQGGQEERVAELLRRMVPFANAEPGCEQYVVNRAHDDPRKFLLYEQYHDRAAFDAHTETEEFKELVLGEIVPLLDRREREFYDVLDAGGG